jgi:hypothetical protein
VLGWLGRWQKDSWIPMNFIMYLAYCFESVRIIYSQPVPMTAHPTPAIAQSGYKAPNKLTTCSLPRTASLNFCTKGTRVCSFSFQNAAMWRCAKNNIAALAALAV